MKSIASVICVRSKAILFLSALVVSGANLWTEAAAAESSSSNKPETADKKDDRGPSFSGNASWYGIPFHGRKTASGELYDMNKLSAAHKTLPFPTKVMVENPKNGQSCVLRITDRGPYARGRVLDLSREAAKRVGIFPGVGYVEATIISSKPSGSSKK